MYKKGNVYYRDHLAGWITQTDDGYEFAYDPFYLASGDAEPVSLTLPLVEAPYHAKVLFPFFDGLIPEGWLLDIVTNQWKLRADDRFELLLNVCRDTIGAVTVVPAESTD